jgi:hypothetical protein
VAASSRELAAVRRHRPRSVRPGQRHLAGARRPVHGAVRPARAAAAGAAPAGDVRRGAAQRLPPGPVGPAVPDRGVRGRHDVRHDRRGPARGSQGARHPPQAGRHRAGVRAGLPGGRPRPAALGALRRGRVLPDHRRPLRPAAVGAGAGPLLRRADGGGDARRPGPGDGARLRRPDGRLLPRRPAGAAGEQGSPRRRDLRALAADAGAGQLGTPPARPGWRCAAAAGAMLPRWARRMYGLPGLPTTDIAATAAGLRSAAACSSCRSRCGRGRT